MLFGTVSRLRSDQPRSMATGVEETTPPLTLVSVPPASILVQKSTTGKTVRKKPWYLIFAGGICMGAALAAYAVRDSAPLLDSNSLSSIFAEFEIPFVDSTRQWLSSTVQPFSIGIEAAAKGQVRSTAFSDDSHCSFRTTFHSLILARRPADQTRLRCYHPWYHLVGTRVVGNEQGISNCTLGRRFDVDAALDDYGQAVVDHCIAIGVSPIPHVVSICSNAHRPKSGNRSRSTGREVQSTSGGGYQCGVRVYSRILYVAQIFSSSWAISDILLEIAGIWAKMIENLSVIGYDNTDLHLASYDWRLSYSNLEVRDKYFSRLKALIEFNLRIHRQSHVVLRYG